MTFGDLGVQALMTTDIPMVTGLTASGIGAADAILRTALLRAIAGPPGLPPCSRSPPDLES